MSVFDYTAIVGVYKGARNVNKIVSALETQTIPPQKIVIFVDGPQSLWSLPSLGVSSEVNIFISTQNLGCFARFAAAALSLTDYVMVLDDDTVPGYYWADNCIDCMRLLSGQAVLGSRGIILTAPSYRPFKESGLYGHNASMEQCDLVGHNWFLPRSLCGSLFTEKPRMWKNGEDIQLSAIAHRLGYLTFTPKHPAGDKRYWGSIDPDLGKDSHRMYLVNPDHGRERDVIVQYWIGKGWKPIFMNRKER